MSREPLEYLVRGRVADSLTTLPIRGVRVTAFDKDLFFDDRLGSADTDADGSYAIRFTDRDFGGRFEGAPEVYVVVYSANEEIHRSRPFRLSPDQTRVTLNISLQQVDG